MEWQEVLNHLSLQNLPWKIYSYLEKYGVEGELYLECSIETRKGVKVADVAWGSRSFFEKYGDITPLKLAPEICIEVCSPSNSDTEMTDKIDLYLAKGAKEVWIVDEFGNLKIYTHEGMVAQSKLMPTFPRQIKIWFIFANWYILGSFLMAFHSST